jgi:AraC-like DNA-binding protein
MTGRLNGGGVVAIAELADELGCYKSTLLKIFKRLNVGPRKTRDADRRNQLKNFHEESNQGVCLDVQ